VFGEVEETDEMIEKIDKYLKGELAKDERIAFEKRVQEDADFAEEVKSQVKAEYAIRTEAKASQKAALKAEYERLAAEGEITPVKPLFQRGGFWVAAAAAVILLLIAVRFLGTSQKMNADELFAAYMEPQSISFTRGDQDTPLINLATAYQSASYAEVIPLAKGLLADSAYASSPKIWLSLAISQLMTDQPQAALESLQHIDEGSAFQEQARWYEALALLKVDRALAREKLEEIAGSGHYMREQAGEMLGRLED
jgi:hypothetical protein